MLCHQVEPILAVLDRVHKAGGDAVVTLRMLNACANGQPAVQEILSLSGVLPRILQFVNTDYPYTVRIEVRTDNHDAPALLS